ncbi:uncharacterized protein LOC126758957 [Bactrocera neohumeralis]|uniref:uncharacterized protein LOC126758957 n=1 Tax=Bactrocera neohumeralis TaxID=98809 RepID=UPI0021652453|nr:uncharacterized protein LOC126758957 [Bactrocera neohumeralis]XP_050329407.1 uncharacterized protein LOC126758957 [Bactrocera neohumeralis]XP_050329408.1 uncharacterized protein LOC126758957 [Bactrocera neohumeralis]XP_050329409.1 uncharacterized protein LOC126758957 [Bactrocera neohumeralis]XP_050329410.1 uncharacterized protein LOC126758957 [Bactrocera neohumeralis]
MAAASLITADTNPPQIEAYEKCKNHKNHRQILINYRRQNNWLWRNCRGQQQHFGTATYWLLVTTLLTLSASSSRADYYRNGDGWQPPQPILPPLQPIPPPLGTIQNVTCIAHDTKFTCDCQSVNQRLQLPHLIGYVFQVEISNCRSLTIEANALEDTQGLRKINFKNVENLILNKYALAFPRYASNTPLIIEFDRVNFELIDSHAINGNIEEISFIGGRIDVINPFGFTTLKDRAILLKMDNVLVKRIEPQAFKKFAVEQLEIRNCIFNTNVPSKAFYELEVLNSLRIHNNNFQEVHSHAFSFKIINKLSITDNYFAAIDAEWIEAYVRESVVIRDNYFGLTSPIAFKGIHIHRDYMHSELLELQFNNNTLQLPVETRPLEFNARFALNIKQLRYENTYGCSDLDTAQKPPIPKQAFFRNNVDNIYVLAKPTKVVAAPMNGMNGQMIAASRSNNEFVLLNKYIETNCQPRSYLIYILLGVLALVLVLLLIGIIVWLQVAKRRKKRKLDVVLPEPRTYKETQIVYQIENAGLLKTDL